MRRLVVFLLFALLTRAGDGGPTDYTSLRAMTEKLLTPLRRIFLDPSLGESQKHEVQHL